MWKATKWVIKEMLLVMTPPQGAAAGVDLTGTSDRHLDSSLMPLGLSQQLWLEGLGPAAVLP